MQSSCWITVSSLRFSVMSILFSDQNASDKIVQSLEQYAYNYGIAFQIIDDILDFKGSEDKIGKPVGNSVIMRLESGVKKNSLTSSLDRPCPLILYYSK